VTPLGVQNAMAIQTAILTIQTAPQVQSLTPPAPDPTDPSASFDSFDSFAVLPFCSLVRWYRI